MSQIRHLTYAESGVDIGAENRSIAVMKAILPSKRIGFGAPMMEIGHYAGLLDMKDFGLAMTTDGVGSKVLIANFLKKWDTVGIDCIAMNVNDLLSIGAEPIAFVDYLAVEKLDIEFAEQIAIGLRKGAEISNIAIIGGETASLPDLIKGFDLAGTAIGIVDKDKVITGTNIELGDAIVGVPSSGLHSNGYTLARKIIAESQYTYFDPMPGSHKTIGDELLTPTRIYMEILDLVKKIDVHGLAHITGSGLLKLRRVTDLGFEINDPLDTQPIFRFLQDLGNVEEAEMYRTFNMGMGFAIIVDEEDAPESCQIMGPGSKMVGSIVEKGLTIRNLSCV